MARIAGREFDYTRPQVTAAQLDGAPAGVSRLTSQLRPQADLMALSRGVVTDASRAGLYDPLGSPVLRARRERAALRRGRSRRQSAMTLARLLGLDPMQMRQVLLDTDRSMADQTSDFLGQADLEEGIAGRDFARGQLGRERDYAENRYLAEQARKEREGGGFGSFLGQAAGLGIGAFTGGVGDELAGRLFKKR